MPLPCPEGHLLQDSDFPSTFSPDPWVVTTGQLARTLDLPAAGLLIRSLEPPLQANIDLLLASGLGGTFQNELTASITAFEEASQSSDESQNSHIEGRSSLLALTSAGRDGTGPRGGTHRHPQPARGLSMHRTYTS